MTVECRSGRSVWLRSTSGVADRRPIWSNLGSCLAPAGGRDQRSRNWRWPCCGGVRSAGPVPGDGLPHGVEVRSGLELAEGGFELAGVDDEGRAELVGRLAHLAEQGR